MVNKVYVVINLDSSDVIYVSNSLVDLEELICDLFMEDYQYEMQNAVDAHWIDMEKPYEDTYIYANDIWNHLINYYKNYIAIQEAPILGCMY